MRKNIQYQNNPGPFSIKSSARRQLCSRASLSAEPIVLPAAEMKSRKNYIQNPYIFWNAQHRELQAQAWNHDKRSYVKSLLMYVFRKILHKVLTSLCMEHIITRDQIVFQRTALLQDLVSLVRRDMPGIRELIKNKYGKIQTLFIQEQHSPLNTLLLFLNHTSKEQYWQQDYHVLPPDLMRLN